MTNIEANSADPNVPAVNAEHTAGGTVIKAYTFGGNAIVATSVKGLAIHASSESDKSGAVYASSDQSIAIHAVSKRATAVCAKSTEGIAIWAKSDESLALLAKSDIGEAFQAQSNEGTAVTAISANNTAVYAQSSDGIALYAYVDSKGPAIKAYSSGTGIETRAEGKQSVGIYSFGNLYAGHFEGDVKITGHIQSQNADCAEDFEVSKTEQIEPGTVMSLNDDGKLGQGKQPYDKRVVGVISGAGNLKPGLVLGREEGSTDKLPIALVGKVNCKVDANYGSVEVGDLLTSSETPGHAMKASDPIRSFGAVIGKALKPLENGRGLIPILVALQ